MRTDEDRERSASNGPFLAFREFSRRAGSCAVNELARAFTSSR